MGHSGEFLFDDGSRGYEDAAGNIVLVDSNGASQGAPSKAIAQQFMDLLNFGVRSAIYQRYGPAANRAAQPVTPQQRQQAQWLGLALLGLGAFVVYKLVS